MEADSIVLNDQIHVSLYTADSLTMAEIAAMHCLNQGLKRAVMNMPTSNTSPAELLALLAPLDPASEVLVVQGNCPQQQEWETVGSHFRHVKRLYIDSGHGELWDDTKFPLEWDLDLLMVASAGPEVVRTPAMLEGRVGHLSLLFTSGLRFEGPSNKELVDQFLQDVEDGEEEGDYIVIEERKVRIPVISTPRLAAAWMEDERLSGEDDSSTEPVEESTQAPSRVHTLEIIENDAIDTFQRLALANAELVMGLQRLALRAMRVHPLYYQIPAGVFPQIMAELGNLTHLELGFSMDTFPDEAIIAHLYKSLPPNLEVLQFRGPYALAFMPEFRDWVEALGDSEFLPNLRSLSFVLDAYGQDENEPPLEMLAGAKAACGRLWEAAESRGVEVEDLIDRWAQITPSLKPVDPRWKDISL